MNFKKNFLNLKKNSFYTLIFFYIVFMFVNYLHLDMDWYKRVNFENQDNFNKLVYFNDYIGTWDVINSASLLSTPPDLTLTSDTSFL